MNIIHMRRGMGEKALYDAEVEYIDVDGKYLETDIDAAIAGGLDIGYSWKISGSIIYGGDFKVYVAGWPGVGSANVRGANLGNTGGNTVRNANNTTATAKLRVYSVDSLDGFYLNPTGGTGGGRLNYTRGSLSSISEKIKVFTDTNGYRIYWLKLYNTNGDLIFNGIPVRKGQKGALYDIINEKMYFWEGIGDYGVGPDVN